MSANKIGQYAGDPLAFIVDLMIPSAHGPRRFGDCMAGFQRDRFAAIVPALLAVARGEKPPIGRHWWEATKGASKDSDLACCLLWLLAFAKRPLDCQVGAADADQADELRKAARDVLHLNPWLARRVTIQNRRIVCEATGAACDIIPADVGGSHGSRPDVLIINELSHVTKQEFAENLADNAAKVPQGLVVVATNAGYVDTWQHKWRELATSSPRWFFHKFDKPAPWLDPAEIAEAERRNSRSRYLRLWWGVWCTGSGDALDADDIAACTDHKSRPMQGSETGFGFVAGLDLGVKNDHAGLVCIGAHGAEQRVQLASCDAWAPSPGGEVDLEAVEFGVLQLAWQFPLAAVGYDPHQAALMAQRLRRQGVNMVEMPFTGRLLAIMADKMLMAFRTRAITLYPDAELIRDLGHARLVEKAYGHRLEFPRNRSGHGDRATALAIAMALGFDFVSDYVPTADDGLGDNLLDLLAGRAINY